MTSTAPRLAFAATLALAAAAWVVAVGRMHGMDHGPRTDLGPLPGFLATWAPMMAAMMLPAAAPAVARAGRGAPTFAAGYLAVWVAVGPLAWALDRPHGPRAAALVLVAAVLYELTPLRRRLAAACRADGRSGARHGLLCVGATLGPTAALLALGAMSVTWTAAAALVVLARR